MLLIKLFILYLHAIYILHKQNYRKRYTTFLKRKIVRIEVPRIAFPENLTFRYVRNLKDILGFVKV